MKRLALNKNGQITKDFFDNQSFEKILAYVNNHKQIESGEKFNPINLNIRIGEE